MLELPYITNSDYNDRLLSLRENFGCYIYFSNVDFFVGVFNLI